MYKDLYLFYNPLNNTLKIGRSSNVSQRLKAIQLQSGLDEIELKLMFPNKGYLEPELHKLFKLQKKHGEWFNVKGILKTYYEYLFYGGDEINYIDLTFLAIIEELWFHEKIDLSKDFIELKKEVKPIFNQLEKLYYSLTTSNRSIGLWEFIKIRKTTFLDNKDNNLSIEERFLNFDYKTLKYSLWHWDNIE